MSVCIIYICNIRCQFESHISSIKCISLCSTFLWYKASVCVLHCCDIGCHFVSYISVIQDVSSCLTLLRYKMSVCVIFFCDIRCPFIIFITEIKVSVCIILDCRTVIQGVSLCLILLDTMYQFVSNTIWKLGYVVSDCVIHKHLIDCDKRC